MPRRSPSTMMLYDCEVQQCRHCGMEHYPAPQPMECYIGYEAAYPQTTPGSVWYSSRRGNLHCLSLIQKQCRREG